MKDYIDSIKFYYCEVLHSLSVFVVNKRTV